MVGELYATTDIDEWEWVATLASLSGEVERREFLAQNPQLHRPTVVTGLCEQIPALSRVDLQQADNVSRAAAWLAEKLGDDACRAHSLRAAGHVYFLKGEHAQARERYQSAVALFERLGADVEVGRTLSSSLQALIYLGEYDQAFAAADRARAIFERAGDRTRLARLDANVGNVLHRLDRFEEALAVYRRAYDELSRSGEPQAVATVLHNMAVCFISLNQFPEALEAYRQARAHCERHNLPLLGVQADYNIAYLHYLRGEYPRATELYQATRELCQKLGDAYHGALCDLDQSEMYLDLGRSEDGADLAQHAFASFEEQGLGYEAAKALAFLGLCTNRLGKAFRALELLGKARQLFAQQRNRAWPALLDLYRALILDQEGRVYEARSFCENALDFYLESSSASKAAICELLLARLYLKLNEPQTAKHLCASVLARLEQQEIPALRCHAYSLIGQVEETTSNQQAAYRAYQQAHGQLENLRTRFRPEELKIGFLKNDPKLYESLVAMSMPSAEGCESGYEEAFGYIQQAKSRAMADLIAFRSRALPTSTGMHSGLVEQIRELREELNWYYRQIDLQEIREESPPERVHSLRQRTRECEDQLARVLRDVRTADQEFAALLNLGTIDLSAMQSVLPPDTILLEYYQARGIVYVGLLDRRDLMVVPLTPAAHIRGLLRSLQQQLSKCQLEPDSSIEGGEEPAPAVQPSLHTLFTELIGPVRRHVRHRHLVVAPHGFLHYLPFHALFDGQRYLVDEHAVSYVPSASVFYLCCQRERQQRENSLILGISEEGVPDHVEEARAVASVLPNARLVLGEAASAECLRAYAPSSRFLHIASTAAFRRDNPMFSTIRFANSRLSLFDLCGLKLSAELVTLSGCSTGFGVAGEGDELLGLERGLLYAGARTLLLSLWNATGVITREFMRVFYAALQSAPDQASALRLAIQRLRESHPHPFYWAPYFLVGKGA